MWEENKVVPSFDNLTEEEMRELVSDQNNATEATPVTTVASVASAASRAASHAASHALTK